MNNELKKPKKITSSLIRKVEQELIFIAGEVSEVNKDSK